MSSRFYRWRSQEVWDQVLAELQAEGDQLSELDWEIHYVDASVLRVHQHAAKGKKVARRRKPLDAVAAE